MRAALNAGCLLDTAAAYGNEREVREAVGSSELDRSEVFLETKIWITDYGYEEDAAPAKRPHISSLADVQ